MLWFSINSESSLNDKSFISYIHSFRFYFPYAAAILSIVWILSIGKKPNLKLWQTGIICYASTILLSGLWHGVEFESLHFHAAMICAITVTVLGSVILEKANKTNEANLIEVFAKTSLIILTAVLLVSFLRDIIQAIIMEEVQGYAIQGLATRQFGMEPHGQQVSRDLRPLFQ